MKKWATACVCIVIFLMFYFLLNNSVLWFTISFTFFPIIITVSHLKENGLPDIQIHKKQTIQIQNIRESKTDFLNSKILKVSLFRMMQEYFVKSYTQDIIPSGTARSSMDLVILRQCFDVMVH